MPESTEQSDEKTGDIRRPPPAKADALARTTSAITTAGGSLVTVHRPERMNLLGLLMRGLLATNLERPELRLRAEKLRGHVAVRAGDMQVTLSFGADGVHIHSPDTDADATVGSGGPRARVRGDMKALLGVVTGAGMVGPVLTGRIRIGGNPFLLLRVLPLIRARANHHETSP